MDNNYLIHHGILGMKWGIRRFQNENGTLTSAGKRRYETNSDKNYRAIKTGQNPKGSTTQPPNKLKGKNPQLEPSNESNGYYMDFYNTHNAGVRISIQSDHDLKDQRTGKEVNQYYTGVSVAAKKEMLKSDKGKEILNRSQCQTNGYTVVNLKTGSVDHYEGEPIELKYSPSEVPDAYMHVRDYNISDDQTKKYINEGLVTKEMIEDMENAADSMIDQYHDQMDKIAQELPKDGPVSPNRENRIINSYGYAQEYGNKAVNYATEASRLRRAYSEQREDPIKFVGALANTVVKSVSSAVENSTVINKAKNFIKGLFGGR